MATVVLRPTTVTLPSLTVAPSAGDEKATVGDGGGGETTWTEMMICCVLLAWFVSRFSAVMSNWLSPG